MKELINRQYVGARYVPKIMGEWNKALQYEALSIVTYMGNSFTSKVPVPANSVDINNTDYWVNTGNYNAQVEEYRQEVTDLKNNMNYVTPEMFGAKGDGVTDDTVAVQNAINSGNNIVCKGLYKLSISEQYEFNGIKNLCINIEDGKVIIGGKFIVPENTTCFYVKNNVKVIGCEFEFNAPTEKVLYTHCGIASTGCSDGIVLNCKANNGNIVALLGCNRFTIKNCIRTTNQKYATKMGSAYLLYGGSKCTIENCKTFGSSGDGDISIYTGNEHVIDKCYASAYSENDEETLQINTLQGICVDAGANNCSVTNCIAKGYFYGFDIKSSTDHIIVSNCISLKNKVGFTCRLGELNQVPFSALFSDCFIISGGNGNDVELLGSVNSGFLLESAQQCVINNCIFIGSDTNFCAFNINNSCVNISNCDVQKEYTKGANNIIMIGKVIRLNNSSAMVSNCSFKNQLPTISDETLFDIVSGKLYMNNCYISYLSKSLFKGDAELIMSNCYIFSKHFATIGGESKITNCEFYLFTEYVAPFISTNNCIFTGNTVELEAGNNWLTNNGENSAVIVKDNILKGGADAEPTITSTNKIVSDNIKL